MKLSFLIPALFAISLFTSLTVEAIKKFAKEAIKSQNILVGCTAFILGIIACVIYGIITKVTPDSVYICETIILAFLSWLCSMVGYDKVVQTIEQIKNKIKK